MLSLAPRSTTASADNPERWGDYSAVTTDPLNAANAWLVNEKVNQQWCSSGEAASSDSDSKQTIPGPVGHSAELGEAVALAASPFLLEPHFSFVVHFSRTSSWGDVIFAATHISSRQL